MCKHLTRLSGLVAVFLLLGLASPAVAEDIVEVELWTLGTGDDLAASWGHVFLRLKGSDPPRDGVFDFGRFDITTTFVLDFVRGELPYYLGAMGTDRAREWLQPMGRSLTVRTLTLPAERSAALVERLRILRKPENRYFVYDPVLANCATAVRDLLDEAVFDGAWKTAAEALPGPTWREGNDAIMADRPGYRWLVHGMNGPISHQPVDRWRGTFLPFQLAAELDAMQAGTGLIPLPPGVSIGAPVELEPGITTPATPVGFVWGLPAWFGGALMLSLVPVWIRPTDLGARRYLLAGGISWGLVGGLLGGVLWALAAHPSPIYAGNLVRLALHPLLLVFPFVMFRARSRAGARRALWGFAAIPLVGCVLMPVVGQWVPYHLIPVAILQVGFAAAVSRAWPLD